MDQATEQRLVKALRRTWDATAADLVAMGVDQDDPEEIVDATVDLVSIYGAEKRKEAQELADLLIQVDEDELKRLAGIAFGGK